MIGQPLEARVAHLETEVARLKTQLENPLSATQPWWSKIVGTFADDEAFDEAMQLGREYRAQAQLNFARADS